MKNLLLTGIFTVSFFLMATVSMAQTSETKESATELSKTKSTDRGADGAITMEEYQTLLAEYQKQNPGKTFQDMKKEEFETYLTTHLYALRKKRAEEAVKAKQAKEVAPTKE